MLCWNRQQVECLTISQFHEYQISQFLLSISQRFDFYFIDIDINMFIS